MVSSRQNDAFALFISAREAPTVPLESGDRRRGRSFLQILAEICIIFSFIRPSIAKVKKILKGSLDPIPSPSTSVKIQVMDGKVCLRCKGKTLLDAINKFLKTKRLLTSPNNFFALLPQVKFSIHNLNFQ